MWGFGIQECQLFILFKSAHLPTMYYHFMKGHFSWTWWCTLVEPAFERWREEEQDFKATGGQPELHEISTKQNNPPPPPGKKPLKTQGLKRSFSS